MIVGLYIHRCLYYLYLCFYFSIYKHGSMMMIKECFYFIKDVECLVFALSIQLIYDSVLVLHRQEKTSFYIV